MKPYTIRPLRPDEYPLLKDFTYQAIFQRENEPQLPYSVLDQPELALYYHHFGKPGDHCLLAEQAGQPAGAVWTRILGGEIKGFGHLDNNTPEFAIALYPGCRNRGIGTELMKAMLELLQKQGYQQASLAVQKDNYAVSLYLKTGFSVLKELDTEYLMVCRLEQPHHNP